MTQAEATIISQTKPVGFVKGSNGIEGFYAEGEDEDAADTSHPCAR